jgi:RNA polymerase sigma factor
VAKNSPKYEKSVKDCRKAVNYLTDNPEIMRVLFETGKLPIKQIAGETLVKRKTLEKHRKYLVTVSVIYFRYSLSPLIFIVFSLVFILIRFTSYSSIDL